MTQAKAPNQPFKADIEAIRNRARAQMYDGAVTKAYMADRDRVLTVLNEVLATEIVCVLRYKSHFYRAKGIARDAVADEFLEHAAEEQTHADMVCERITQLDGDPNLNPEGLASRSHSEYRNGETLADLIKEDLVAERIAIETYSEIVRWLGDDDPTTRRMMESILAMEEEHASDLNDLLGGVAGEDVHASRNGAAASKAKK
ncbi:MAG: ferritin-like domain-containing protein [Tepidiformaceae bacterium]